MTVKEESQQKDNILSPSADVASKEALPSAGSVATEVSPGDEAQSPSNNKVEDMEGGGEGDEDVGFGPPPAFPSSSKLGKRKRTIMAVSETAAAAAGGGAPLEDETSSEDGEEGGIKKKANKNSQSIHRGIKEEVKSPVDEEGSRKYSDAMLLASLSDVEGTPKKNGTEFADGNNTTTATTSKVPQVSGGGGSPKAKLPSSSAPTPQRSNVHAPRPGEPIKPFALLPKQGPGLSTSASKSPDAARDPKNEKGGAMYNPYPPQHGYHPSYAYPPTSGYGYPYYGYSSYPPHPYYPPPSHPSAAAPPSTEVPTSPEKWGPYHSPKHQERKTTPAAKGPEKVHSTTAPFHPLSTSSSKISEEGDTTGASFPGPPPMYYDPRYGPPPPPAYNNMGPPAGVSRDDGSPPRSSSSTRGPPPSVHTPPRSAPYYDPAAYAPPQPGNPDSPPRSSYPPSSYPGAPPPDPYEQYAYDPTTTSPSASGDAHYHVPASVSNETDHSPNSGKYHQFRKGGRSIHSVPIILRKKFSWRNYPELEEYLIANRTDYLRHSALNYTAEQKHFNNRLTEGLLELAAKLNYVFDETCFNFVAVRDRIRCYYKSYVQSSKKRGVVVGFSRQEDGGLVEKEKIMKC